MHLVTLSIATLLVFQLLRDLFLGERLIASTFVVSLEADDPAVQNATFSTLILVLFLRAYLTILFGLDCDVRDHFHRRLCLCHGRYLRLLVSYYVIDFFLEAALLNLTEKIKQHFSFILI